MKKLRKTIFTKSTYFVKKDYWTVYIG